MLLSKSKYLAGLQCPKYLWILFHEPGKIPEVDQATQHRFDQGHLVGELAKLLYPKGIDIPSNNFMGNIKKTKEMLKLKKPLFEPGFKPGNIFARADILNPVQDNKWDIIEVKSSTQVKDINLHDLSFQKYCYGQEGIRIGKCFLMHINNQYVRDGEINPKEFFIAEDVTSEVRELSKEVKERIEGMFKIIDRKVCPEIGINAQCSDPYDCALSADCWSHLPENSVFDLYRGGKTSFELYESGIRAIKDIPDDCKLSSNQEIQKECEKTGKPYINKIKISNFLRQLEYPLYFLDFETYNTSIPQYDGLKPYQQIPFQFSLHILKSIDSEAEHYSFLALGDKDPRLDFLLSLKKVISKKGSVVVYNQAFEKRILNELCTAFPEQKEWIYPVIDRLVDLLVPFRSFYYYHPKQQGSASIKKVLPAVTGKTYDDLEIAGGETASLQYLYIAHGATDGTMPNEEEIKKIRDDLEKYCCLDTEGMVEIVKKLLNL